MMNEKAVSFDCHGDEIEGVYRSGCFGVNVEEFTKKGLQVKGFNS